MLEWFEACGWPFPEITDGLGVVVNRAGKKRLIQDYRYLNLFLSYIKFCFEKLADVKEYIAQGDWMSVTGFKSGYHALAMHCDAVPYLGSSFKGRVYTFTHLPLGLALACFMYTEVMSLVYRPLSSQGECLSCVFGDMLMACAAKDVCKFYLKTFAPHG